MSLNKIFKLPNHEMDWYSTFEKEGSRFSWLLGIWHGFILPITIIISIIRKNQHLVEGHMSGGYYIGFITTGISYVGLIKTILNGLLSI